MRNNESHWSGLSYIYGYICIDLWARVIYNLLEAVLNIEDVQFHPQNSRLWQVQHPGSYPLLLPED